jgi:predicted amidophosphoribosyltransferase
MGRWLARQMTSTAQAAFPLEEIHLVAPVPLHWLKRRLKGDHPAGALAAAVSQALEKPYRPGALRMIRWTPSQTRLHGRQRIRNVRGAFAADPRAVRNRIVLLVDDVLTSGATAHACALALKRAGARAVYVLAAARTPSHAEETRTVAK